MNFSSYYDYDEKEMVYFINGEKVKKQEWLDSMDRWAAKPASGEAANE